MRAAGTFALLARPRLVELLAAEPVGLLEAPAGYGKTVVAGQVLAGDDRAAVRMVAGGSGGLDGFLAGLGRALARKGCADLADGLGGRPDAALDRFVGRLARRPGGVGLAVDDAQRLDPRSAEWLAELAQRLPPSSRLVVVGRRIGRRLGGLADTGEAHLVDAAALCFDEFEVAALLAANGREPEPAAVADLVAATGGWPAAVVLWLARARRPTGRGPGAVSAVVAIDALVDDLLAPLDVPTRDLLVAAAAVPLLSAEVLAAVAGPGALDRALDAGLPVHFGPDGWGYLADPVRAALRRRGRLSAAQGRSVATVLAGAGELFDALELLRGVGELDAAMSLLAEQPWAGLAALGLPAVALLLEAVPDVHLVGHTALLARAALAAEQRAPDLRAAFLNRAVRLSGDDPSPDRRAVDAERSRELGREGRLDEAMALAGAVLAAAGPDEALTRARAHQSRALAALVRANGDGDGTVIRDLETAAALFRSAGEPAWEASALIALGYGVHHQRGMLTLAERSLATAVGLLAAPDLSRGLCLTYYAEILTHLGRAEAADAALREAEQLGRHLGHDDLVAYAAWTRAELCAQQRDRIGVETALATALAHPGSWYERLAAIDFHANAAEMRLLVGDRAGARVDLEEAGRRAGDGDYRFMLVGARARYETTVGDVGRAEAALEELDRLGVPRDAPTRWLLRAVCAQRRGDPAAAATRLARALSEARAIDDPDRLERREPELLACLSAAGEARAPALHVQLLGGFAVHDGGTEVTPPAGHGATLVKLVALRGTVSLDEAVDVLWPDADLDTGRTRLRNVVNRVRTGRGPLLRRADGGLSLPEGAITDVGEFERVVGDALRAPAAERAGLARQALAHHRGELLPVDRYADWTAAPRGRLHRSYLAMVDLVTADALERGDLDDAIRLLDEAIEAEPLDLDRYATAARALYGQGRVAAARALIERARSICADLGVPPPAGVAEWDAELAD